MNREERAREYRTGEYRNRETVNESESVSFRIEREYEEFRRHVLKLDSSEIWERCKRIRFYCCIREYFEYNRSVDRNILNYVAGLPMPVRTMWEYYLKHESYYCDTWEEITAMICSMMGKEEGGMQSWQVISKAC